MPLAPPVPIDETHVLANFDCEHESLTLWLKDKALKNHAQGASRCYVVRDGNDVVGYYALAAGAVELQSAPGAIRRNMPAPIPVIVLGRLAVHKRHAGQRIGAGLLKDAILRSRRAAGEIGARALLCHAIDEKAKRFYLHHDFIESPSDPLTLMIRL